MASITHSYRSTDHLYWILRIAYGLFWVAAGADKLSKAFYLLVNWEKYLSNIVVKNVGIDATTLLTGVGILEIILGLIILSGKTKIGGYLSIAWLTIIIINLLVTGHYFDIAVRDIMILVGSFALAQVTDIKEELAKV